MAALRRWLAVLAGVMAGLLLSGTAWASRSPGVVVLAEEVARRRRGFGGFGLLALCCLGVVALVVLAVLLIARGRRSRGGPR